MNGSISFDPEKKKECPHIRTMDVALDKEVKMAEQRRSPSLFINRSCMSTTNHPSIHHLTIYVDVRPRRSY